MRLINVNIIHIYPIHEPSLFFRNLNIVPTHLSLSHLSISRESPVLKPIAPLPLHSIRAITILVPKDRD
jgi:hypothetical protein